MNQSILHIVLRGDWVTQSTALLLLLMSILTWSIFFYKYFLFKKTRQDIQIHMHNFWQGDTAALPISNKSLLPGITAHHLQAPAHVRQSALRQALQAAHQNLHHGLGLLATISSTAPFVGLLGTVWGVYHALSVIHMDAGIEKLATPVGEALAMTAFGLLVALPAVLAYNLLSKKMQYIYQSLQGLAYDIEQYHQNLS